MCAHMLAPAHFSQGLLRLGIAGAGHELLNAECIYIYILAYVYIDVVFIWDIYKGYLCLSAADSALRKA